MLHANIGEDHVTGDMVGGEGGLQVRGQLGRNLTFGLLEVLGRSIVVGEYRGRAFPTEAELVKLHGVSRSVTREAVKMLGAKGLLGARPKQGTFVQPDEQWNLFDTDVLRWLLERKSSIVLLRRFNELRIGVEPQAAWLAAQRATADQRAAIAAGLVRMHDAEMGDDDTLDADIAFHVAILRASNNPFFVQFREVVSTALRTSIRFTNRISGRSASIADHAAVADAIQAGDAAAARAAMAKLIDDVLQLIERDADQRE
ncbi:FadR family transcriptional regulator [Microvirga sp. SRT01]|uniref:FadR family transcriptional regulator n=2 Tax=Sphingomonas longa TaxID=2778730 RepID=A0ABS2D7W8_9SPHN|nr:FadR/GntR family transcriptional regulator [Microvirga sp. SRT01]MBM6577039.1 FadR family transcriptional regulator [Sphingomonas sp. BT552]MBR7710083.1 FadR family transcriptional regulator [Microvirga sp. SRT01]